MNCDQEHPEAIILANKRAAEGTWVITEGMIETDHFCTVCWHFCGDEPRREA